MGTGTGGTEQLVKFYTRLTDMKKMIFIGILGMLSVSLGAQTKYELSLRVDSTKKELLELINDRDGEKLLDLPVAFQLTNKNNLVILFGNGETLPNEYTVWMFAPAILLKDFLKKNKNVIANKEFANSNSQLGKFFAEKGLEYLSQYKFDEEYQMIRKIPKPVFFQLTDREAELYLYFYVSIPNKKDSDLNELIAKTKPIKITIKIDNNNNKKGKR